MKLMFLTLAWLLFIQFAEAHQEQSDSESSSTKSEIVREIK